ncbi:MAG: hypothetical protein H6907_20030 [Hyphomicrobiales bacterium]|nr:hypothetical protein [Hyphomicrobiales bacterium]MCP5374029.1 hypothetical protein [Hyphomicrobiales bacterium]
MRTILASTIIALTAAAVVGTHAAPAQAQACAKREDIVKTLASQYGEARTARGVSQTANSLVELFTGPSGTWSLVVTGPTGISCLVSAGENWETVPDKMVAKAEPGGI